MTRVLWTAAALMLGACGEPADTTQDGAETASTGTPSAPAADMDAADRNEPLLKPWGYPLDALDRSVDPGDDFFRFANGGWLDATEIPEDRSVYSFSTIMRERNEERIDTVISELAAAEDLSDGSDGQKIRDLYASFMDTDRIEALGAQPLEPYLTEIAALGSHEAVARAMIDPRLGVPGPFSMYVWIDSKNPDSYVTWVGHAGLGMPDKSYYLRDEERLTEIRMEYRAFVERMLTLGGVENAAEKAQGIFELETEIAKLHWDREDRRDATKTYNRMTVSDLNEFAPGFPWNAALNEGGIGAVTDLVVQERDAFPGLARLFADTPVEAWRDYLTFHMIREAAPFLTSEFDEANFAFYGTVLSGTEAQRPRDKRAIQLVDNTLDQIVGKVYVDRFFPEESKEAADELFANVRAALRTRIQNLTWMTGETKAAALEKLDKMGAKIGYPEVWEEYPFDVRPDDLIGNMQRAAVHGWERNVGRLGTTVDKREWFSGPQTVNAFYSASRNEAFIPAGYLQSPLFDPHADPALNYGAIGTIIGHEIGHGFDDQGSKYDANGELRDWWTEEDRANFEALGDRFAAQFDEYEPVEGYNVNGRLTLGENIGDLAGMVVAYHAYLLSLDGAEPPVLDGFTGEQRFFLGRAQGRRGKYREEALRQQLIRGPHSPLSLRVNGMVRNMDEWYEAFDIGPDAAMYLPPDQRVRIW